MPFAELSIQRSMTKAVNSTGLFIFLGFCFSLI